MSFVAYAGDEGTTSEAIAEKASRTNTVVVRKNPSSSSSERTGRLPPKAAKAASVSARGISHYHSVRIYRRLKRRAEFLRCAPGA